VCLRVLLRDRECLYRYYFLRNNGAFVLMSCWWWSLAKCVLHKQLSRGTAPQSLTPKPSRASGSNYAASLFNLKVFIFVNNLVQLASPLSSSTRLPTSIVLRICGSVEPKTSWFNLGSTEVEPRFITRLNPDVRLCHNRGFRRFPGAELEGSTTEFWFKPH